MSEQNTNTAVVELPRRSILTTMANRYDMEPQAFEATLRGTIMKPDKDGNCPTREEFAAFLVVANEYNLNPLTKEIYAFFDRQKGGIVPIVGVDGWARIINEHAAFNGMKFVDTMDGEKVAAITCQMFRKDRDHPIEATEYLAECRRDTTPWKTWPRRMLRHKAMIQAARYAFGFAGIYDQDEAERIAGNYARDVTPTSNLSALQQRLQSTGAKAPIDMVDHVDQETGEVTNSDRGSPAAKDTESKVDVGHASAGISVSDLTPRQEGRAAYHGGGTESDCPSYRSKADRDDWLAGFREAADENNDSFPGDRA